MKAKRKEHAPAGDKGPAKKLDAGKIPAFQGLVARFSRALFSVAEISLFGKTKYGTYDGWEKVPEADKRYMDAQLRHILKRAMGESIDPDSNLLHAAHAAWNALAVLELELRKREGL